MSPRIRIGAVSYLNTKPLVFGLAERLPEAEILLDYPSRLAEALAQGELDVALVPVAEMLNHPTWQTVSDACISSRGPVLSVKLLFRTSPVEVKTLALDEGSRTSALLSQVLLRELYDVQPQLTTLPLGQTASDVNADAILVIGDRAIAPPEEPFAEVWDLGDRWCRWTELPFVFAMWVGQGPVDPRVAEALAAARDEGCQNAQRIARQQSAALDLPLELVQEYLTRNLHFRFGERERQGLELFFERVQAWDLCHAPV